jgi:hypothetical protein
VLAAWWPTSVSVELAVGIQIVGFQVTVDGFSARTGGPTARSRLHDDERGVLFLGNLRWRQPGLLQRGILAEQRFLQRPSHTVPLQPVKILASSAHLPTAFGDGAARQFPLIPAPLLGNPAPAAIAREPS